MRIVLDTNIFISALITDGTPPDLLYQSWRSGEFSLLTSEEQLAELAMVIRYEKLKPFIDAKNAWQLFSTIQEEAVMVDNITEVSFSKDTDDNKIIALAITGGADYLISGDKKGLLSLKEVEGIPIITARQALELFT